MHELCISPRQVLDRRITKIIASFKGTAVRARKPAKNDYPKNNNGTLVQRSFGTHYRN
jgi:hypothetical protein